LKKPIRKREPTHGEHGLRRGDQHSKGGADPLFRRKFAQTARHHILKKDRQVERGGAQPFQ